MNINKTLDYEHIQNKNKYKYLKTIGNINFLINALMFSASDLQLIGQS